MTPELIKTAPKDGTAILAWIPYSSGGGRWVVAEWSDWGDGVGWYEGDDKIPSPTHWLPLPPPMSSRNHDT